MKTLGLLGGTSYPSTFEYYNLINRMINQALGAFHSAKIILYSIDYNEIKSNYGAGWDKIPALLKKELDILCSTPIDGLIICNNTLHKALDILQQQGEFKFQGEIFHALHLAALSAKQRDFKRVLLLGTKYTMTADFFKNYFYAENIEVITPDEQEMDALQTIQTRLSLGKIAHSDKGFFEVLLQKYQSKADAVILGCTELPLVITDELCDKPLINPIVLQCERAVEFSLS